MWWRNIPTTCFWGQARTPSSSNMIEFALGRGRQNAPKSVGKYPNPTCSCSREQPTPMIQGTTTSDTEITISSIKGSNIIAKMGSRSGSTNTPNSHSSSGSPPTRSKSSLCWTTFCPLPVWRNMAEISPAWRWLPTSILKCLISTWKKP